MSKHVGGESCEGEKKKKKDGGKQRQKMKKKKRTEEMKNKHWAAAGGDRRRTDDTLYSGWVWEWRFYIRLHFMSSVGVLSPRQGDREGWKPDSCAERLQLRNSSVWIINSIKDFWINDESDKERSLQPRHAVASVYSEISVWLSDAFGGFGQWTDRSR